MPRGEHPNSRANLKPENGRRFTKENAREMQARSTEAKRQLKTFKELDDEFTTDDERKKMLEVLKKRALQGNLRAYELYRDSMGMKPVDKVEQTTASVTIDLGALNDND